MTKAIQNSDEFTPEQAAEILRRHVDSIPPSQGAMIARVPDLDAGGLYAFSVMPSSGLAGEIVYLLGPDEKLSSGFQSTFIEVMNRLGVGRQPHVVDIHRFARLFTRLFINRRGVVLEEPDGHVLLEPGQLPPESFSPPEVSFDSAGARFRFWLFDTDWLEPLFFDVRVAPDGTTTYTNE